MYRVGVTVSAGVLLAGGIAGVTMLGASEAQVAQQDQQIEQFEGRIVNLYYHMTEPEEYWDNDNDNDNGLWDDDNDNDMQRDRHHRPQRDQMMRDAKNPLAIVVEEDRLIGTTTNSFVLVFEPDARAPMQPGARPGQQPGRQPGQQPGRQPGQQPGDRDWDDNDHERDRDRQRQMADQDMAEQLRQHVGEHVTIRGTKFERDDLTVILVDRLETPDRRPAQPGQQPGAQPGQQPRR